MRCPVCDAEDSKVVDSRTSQDAVRRRRECLRCGERFTTHERVERRAVWIVKKDGRKEPFSRDKVLSGVALACRKRPVDAAQMEALAERVEAALDARRDAEIPSAVVGEAVLDALREVDEVAWVRFASVYRAFDSVEQFVETIAPLRTPVGGAS
jgi:transcriptional repressor NrdR